MNKLNALFALTMLVNLPLFSQDNIVLYNGVPYTVQLEGAEIKTIIGQAQESYMDGYHVIQKNTDRTPKPTIHSASVNNTSFAGNSEKSSIKETSSEMVELISDSKTTLNFKSNYATLSKLSLKILDEAAEKIKSGEQQEILITCHEVTGRPTTKVLANKRAQASRSYLKIKGVPDDKIQEELLITDYQLQDIVYLTFMKVK